MFTVRHRNSVHQRQIDCSSCLLLLRVLRARNLAFGRAQTRHSKLRTHRVLQTERRAVKHRRLRHLHQAVRQHSQQKLQQADQRQNAEKPTANH